LSDAVQFSTVFLFLFFALLKSDFKEIKFEFCQIELIRITDKPIIGRWSFA